MNAAWSILAALAILVVTTAVGDLFSDEIRTRLERLPHALLRLNARLQPAELRADLLEEWQAELDFILRDTGGLPLTRLWRGARYAASLLRAAPWLTRDLTWETAGRTAAGILGAAFGTVGLLILFDGGRYGAVGEFIADLRLAADHGPTGTSLAVWGIVNGAATIALAGSCIIFGSACTILGWADPAGRDPWQVFAVPAYVGAIGMIPMGVGGVLTEVAGVGITGSMPDRMFTLSAPVPLLLAALMVGVYRSAARRPVAIPG